MKVNKTIIIGFLFIVFAGIIFVTDIFNPIIRPITYLFLMGSSKGKDIIFFGLLGLFLILSQMFNRKSDDEKYLKISIILGGVLLISGILLEVIFRLQLGIGLNTVFCSMGKSMTSTSILHTHLLKSIFGGVLVNLLGPVIGNGINTGVGLYHYVPTFGFLVILLLPVLFITIVLSSQKRPWPTNFLLAFFSSCLLIGILDGGMFATPSYIGIIGLLLVYRNGYYINYIFGQILNDEKLLEQNRLNPPSYGKYKPHDIKYIFNRTLVWIVLIAFILLRFTIAFAGAETDYYTVEVINPTGDIDLGNISVKVIDNETSLNKITYHIDPSYNEMELINDLKVPLNNSCEYYTVSWNVHSYFE